ncbi:hypothetical protein GZL_04740 [Streptomyces sp. 769]|nr:hypothetical protein GZL_04740 [Streptomyces sp. 769]
MKRHDLVVSRETRGGVVSRETAGMLLFHVKPHAESAR